MEHYGKRGSFLGFTYNNIHSSTLGITRVSSSNRYDDGLLPTLKEVTSDIVGAPGKNYFGTTYTKREISVSFVFDGLTDQQLRDMYVLWNGKQIHDLIFDERPYKVYSAKITGNSTIKHLVFTEGKNKIYRGEGMIKFTCYFPFARSRYNWQEDYTLDNIPEWRTEDEIYIEDLTQYGNLYYDFNTGQDALGALQEEESEFVWVEPRSLLLHTLDNETDETENEFVEILTYKPSTYINYSDWIESSQIPSRSGYGVYSNNTVKLFNAGDVEMPTQWWFKMPNGKKDYFISIGDNPKLEITQLEKNIAPSPYGLGEDKYFVIDMPNKLIQGYDKNMQPTGRIYNKFISNGDFFGIPQGEQIIACTQQPYDIKFNYLYL